MKDYYKFIDETTVKKYNGGILKLYEDNLCIEGTSNPTPEILKRYRYKELVKDEPLEEKEGYFIETYYVDGEVITETYRYIELPEEEFIEESEVTE